MTTLTTKETKQKTSILIIEDDFEYGNLIEELLQAYGYLTQLARTGKDGQQHASSAEFDLAIVDNGLPDMTGIELTQELQRLGVPFMMLSGSADPEVVKQTSVTGAHAYLIKPVSPEQLFSTLEATLRRAEEMKDLRDSSARLSSSVSKNRKISVAIGILIQHLKLPEEEVYMRLRNIARSERRKLSEIAHELVDASELCNRKLEQYRIT